MQVYQLGYNGEYKNEFIVAKTRLHIWMQLYTGLTDSQKEDLQLKGNICTKRRKDLEG